MSLTIDLLFYILAAVCFFIGWIGVPNTPAWNWTNGGLFFVTLALAF